jgi:DNA-binding NarL/FixJ family response regulator
MATTVLIYEDNLALSQSIGSMLSLNGQYEVVGQYESPVEITRHAADLRPGLILMDIDMPGMTGIEGVKKIRRAGLDIPVLILTVFDDNVNVFNAIRAGASGYLLKKDIPLKLFDALHEILTGGAPMSPSIARMVIGSMQQPQLSPNDNRYQLTPREKEILLSLSKGNSYKLIANEYGISIDTVRGHIKKIYEKLQVHSQTEAVSKAIHERLV